MKSEPENEAAVNQLGTAEHLETKFKDALRELDGRTTVLLGFFNECEAKLVRLEHSKRDL